MKLRASRAALVRHRWRAHGFAGPLGDTPQEIVGKLVAVQAENYPLAKWSLAQRAAGLTDGAIELAVADGTVLRTHLLRPTWHFVLPRDIRWIQRLTGPRVRAMTASRRRQLELAPRLLARCHDLIARALEGGRHLTRGELGDRLARAGISARAGRLAHIVLDAELECLICSGAPRGNSQTYALVDERAPQGEQLEREEGLAELARCYFTSRGPATEMDFRWWASLRAADARQAIAAARSGLESVDFEGRTYWRGPDGGLPATRRSPGVHLLQMLDEYVVSYTSSRHLMLPSGSDRFSVFGETGRQHPVLRRGQVIGIWQRRIRDAALEVTLRRASRLERAEREAVADAAVRQGRFFGMTVEVIQAR